MLHFVNLVVIVVRGLVPLHLTRRLMHLLLTAKNDTLGGAIDMWLFVVTLSQKLLQKRDKFSYA